MPPPRALSHRRVRQPCSADGPRPPAAQAAPVGPPERPSEDADRGLPAWDAVRVLGRGLFGGLVGVLVDAMRP